MKVLYIIPYDWGGIPHYTIELANAISNYANVFVIACRSMQDNYFSKNVKLIRLFDTFDFSINDFSRLLSYNNIKCFISFRELPHIINEINPDVIHLTAPLIIPLAFFMSVYRLDKEYPIIHTRHSVFPISGLKLRFLDAIIVAPCEKMMKFDEIIVHTQNDKRDLQKIKKYENIKVSVIHHGSYSLFNYSKTISREKNCIMFFGYIKKYKGLEYLLASIPLVSKNISGLKVIIAGEGDLSNYYHLIDNIDKSKYEIYNDYITDDKVSELFQRADLLVLPYSQMSGQSGVLNIAATFGRPVVATNVGGFHEVVEDGITGYLVPPKNPEKLAEAIVNILKNDDLKEKMSMMIKSKADELSWDNAAKKHIGVYSELISKSHLSPTDQE